MNALEHLSYEEKPNELGLLSETEMLWQIA